MTKAPWVQAAKEQYKMRMNQPRVTSAQAFAQAQRIAKESAERGETQITKARLLLETGSITVDEAEELSAFLQGEDVDVSAILESHEQDQLHATP